MPFYRFRKTEEKEEKNPRGFSFPHTGAGRGMGMPGGQRLGRMTKPCPEGPGFGRGGGRGKGKRRK